MAAEVNCFISFCEADGNPAEISVLIDELIRLTDGRVKFLCSAELEIGGDIKAHEANLDSTSDACIVIGTPEYKKRADLRQLGSGVFREYQALLRRIDAVNEARPGQRPPSPLKIVPVIWKGTFETSLPSLFDGRHKAADLSRFVTYQVDGGHRRLASDSRRYIAGDLTEIAKTLLALAAAASPSEDARKAAYHDFDLTFFNRRKREREDVPEFNDRLFVKTRQSIRVREQDEFLLVGRKGIGKTTLITSISEDEAFNCPIEVIVDEWNVHGTTLMQFRQSAGSDFSYIHKDQVEAFILLWSAFIFLEVLRAGRVMQRQDVVELRLNEASEEYLNIKPSAGLAAQFILASEVVTKFVQSVVDAAPTHSRAKFDAFLSSRLDVDHLLVWLSGSHDVLAKALRAASSHRHLFSLDGFDNKFQRARNEALNAGPDYRGLIVQTEVDWLTALVEVVEHIKKPTRRAGMKALAGLRFLTICVALPKDRFLEVQRSRRDSIMAGSTREFRWTGIELASLLRKRIEFAGGFDTRDAKRRRVQPIERLNEALAIYARELNTTVGVHIDGRAFEFDLFLEVLRHTFWRPRDVLIHYAEMLAVLKSNRRFKRVTMPQVLSAVIARTNNIIIQDEWIDEVKQHLTNVEEVIGVFKNAPQVLEYDEALQRLSDTEFIFMHRSVETDGAGKLELLYELGFFGTRKKVSSSGHQHRMKDVFYHIYSEHVDFSDRQFGSSVSLLIHPIFIERLNLDPGGGEPVSNLDWTSIDLHDAAG